MIRSLKHRAPDFEGFRFLLVGLRVGFWFHFLGVSLSNQRSQTLLVKCFNITPKPGGSIFKV